MDLGLGHRSCARDPPRNGAERTRTRPDGAAAWRTARSERAEATRSRLTRGGRAWRRDGGSRGCGVVVHVDDWRDPSRPRRLRGRRRHRDAVRIRLESLWVSGDALSRSRRRGTREARDGGRVRCAPARASSPRHPRVARRRRTRPPLVGRGPPRGVPGRRRRLLRARYPSRRARRRARFPSPARHHGRGVGQTAARVQPEYRQFTQRAKDRISAKGPMIGDMVRKNVAPPKPMPGQPLPRTST